MGGVLSRVVAGFGQRAIRLALTGLSFSILIAFGTADASTKDGSSRPGLQTQTRPQEIEASPIIDPDNIVPLAFAFILGLAVVGIAAALIIRRGDAVDPALSDAIARLAAGQQAVRLSEDKAPGASAHVILNFNKLAATLDIFTRERSLLTAGVAHELRTPLTVLKGRLHGLQDGIVDPTKGEAEQLLRHCDQLLRVVGDLTTLAEADSGKLHLDLRTVDLAVLVQKIADDMRPLASTLDIALEKQYRSLSVLIDPVRFGQILTILLSNALKHAPVGSIVSLAMDQDDGWAIVRVSDEGPGLDEQERERLFVPFWRGNGTKASGRPGSGLGLALCAMFTEAQGGSISVDGTPDRQGTCVSVRFPIRPQH